MPQINIRVDRATHERLASIAAETGTTISDVVRQGVFSAIDNREREREFNELRSFIRAETDETIAAMRKIRDQYIESLDRSMQAAIEKHIEKHQEWLKKSFGQ